MLIEYKKFKDVNLNDPFFTSLKTDYAEFPEWFARKSEESAYVFINDAGCIDGFLYLKVENGVIDDVVPPLPERKRIKVGTLKINAHGTKLGERFLKKIFDHAIYEQVKEIYVTVFEHHDSLLTLLQRYGFLSRATKTTQNGTELVLVKDLSEGFTDVVTSYPRLYLAKQKVFLLSLYPKWHTRLLPDSILKTENADIVQDISHTNSIHKVYLTAIDKIQQVRRGDILLIYRTTDIEGQARYRSVATSICVVEEQRSISSFTSINDFLDYCRPYSVFSETELTEYWNGKKYPHLIRFTYNIALKKRVTRATMIDDIGLDANAYWGFMRLTRQQFMGIARKGMVDESLIVY